MFVTNKYLRLSSILIIIFITLSLTGCSSASEDSENPLLDLLGFSKSKTQDQDTGEDKDSENEKQDEPDQPDTQDNQENEGNDTYFMANNKVLDQVEALSGNYLGAEESTILGFRINENEPYITYGFYRTDYGASFHVYAIEILKERVLKFYFDVATIDGQEQEVNESLTVDLGPEGDGTMTITNKSFDLGTSGSMKDVDSGDFKLIEE